jgi:glycosyltransferase involved in cell wall biosynthesis
VDILSPVTSGEKPYPVPSGVQLFQCNRTPIFSKVFREFSFDLFFFLDKKIYQYDIIHIHGIWHFGSIIPFLLKHSAALVFTIHGLLDPWALRNSKWKKKLVTALFQRKYLGRADLIHVLNTDEEQDVLAYLGYRPRNLVIIPNGMKLTDYQQLPPKGTFRKQFNLPETKKLLLFMGRLNTKKGLDLLLPAFRAYNQKFPDTLLILAGPDDGYLEKAHSFISENQLQEAVRLVGMLTDEVKKAALADADVFVLPSYSEGFSIAVLEAMASGVPAVVSDRVGFGDYIRQYEAACLTPLTPQGLSKCLESTLQQPQYRTLIARNAHRMVTENFDIQVVANQLLQEYKKISHAE